MQAEHRISQSDDPSQRHIYSNCFYICERCNKSRGATSNHEHGLALLDPCTVAWADHFERVGDTVRPRPNNHSAQYTWEIYDLDDPSKVQTRERRRYWLERYAEALLDCANLELMLLDKAVDEADDRDSAKTDRRLAVAQSLRRIESSLLEKLAEFSPIPKNRSSSCRCGRTEHLSLFEGLAEQTIDLPELLTQAKKHRKE